MVNGELIDHVLGALLDNMGAMATPAGSSRDDPPARPAKTATPALLVSGASLLLAVGVEIAFIRWLDLAPTDEICRGGDGGDALLTSASLALLAGGIVALALALLVPRGARLRGWAIAAGAAEIALAVILIFLNVSLIFASTFAGFGCGVPP